MTASGSVSSSSGPRVGTDVGAGALGSYGFTTAAVKVDADADLRVTLAY